MKNDLERKKENTTEWRMDFHLIRKTGLKTHPLQPAIFTEDVDITKNRIVCPLLFRI
jgi:hypothetical protein